MDDQFKIPAIISVVTGFISWSAINIAEGAVSDASYSIINDLAANVYHLNPAAVSIIGLIPSVLIACGTFLTINSILKKIYHLTD